MGFRATSTSTLADFKILERLGSGSFGVVYKVKRLADNTTYVLKQINIDGMSPKEQAAAYNEVKLLYEICSPHVVTYYDSFLDGFYLNIIMEYCDLGDLQQALKRQNGKMVTEATIWGIFIQICLGVHTLHSMRILHRDLKAANVFLSQNRRVKIGDLGVARVLGTDTHFAKTCVGTPYYLSPELCEDKPYNQKSDVWALGCILYECCTLKHPFDARNQGALILKILQGHYPPIPNSYSEDIHRLVHWLLARDSDKRPTTTELLCDEAIIQHAQQLGIQLPEDILLAFEREQVKRAARIREQQSHRAAIAQQRAAIARLSKPRPTLTKQDTFPYIIDGQDINHSSAIQKPTRTNSNRAITLTTVSPELDTSDISIQSDIESKNMESVNSNHPPQIHTSHSSHRVRHRSTTPRIRTSGVSNISRERVKTADTRTLNTSSSSHRVDHTLNKIRPISASPTKQQQQEQEMDEQISSRSTSPTDMHNYTTDQFYPTAESNRQLISSPMKHSTKVSHVSTSEHERPTTSRQWYQLPEEEIDQMIKLDQATIDYSTYKRDTKLSRRPNSAVPYTRKSRNVNSIKHTTTGQSDRSLHTDTHATDKLIGLVGSPLRPSTSYTSQSNRAFQTDTHSTEKLIGLVGSPLRPSTSCTGYRSPPKYHREKHKLSDNSSQSMHNLHADVFHIQSSSVSKRPTSSFQRDETNTQTKSPIQRTNSPSKSHSKLVPNTPKRKNRQISRNDAHDTTNHNPSPWTSPVQTNHPIQRHGSSDTRTNLNRNSLRVTLSDLHAAQDESSRRGHKVKESKVEDEVEMKLNDDDVDSHQNNDKVTVDANGEVTVDANGDKFDHATRTLHEATDTETTNPHSSTIQSLYESKENELFEIDSSSVNSHTSDEDEMVDCSWKLDRDGWGSPDNSTSNFPASHGLSDTQEYLTQLSLQCDAQEKDAIELERQNKTSTNMTGTQGGNNNNTTTKNGGVGSTQGGNNNNTTQLNDTKRRNTHKTNQHSSFYLTRDQSTVFEQSVCEDSMSETYSTDTFEDDLSESNYKNNIRPSVRNAVFASAVREHLEHAPLFVHQDECLQNISHIPPPEDDAFENIQQDGLPQPFELEQFESLVKERIHLLHKAKEWRTLCVQVATLEPTMTTLLEQIDTTNEHTSDPTVELSPQMDNLLSKLSWQQQAAYFKLQYCVGRLHDNILDLQELIE